MFYPEVADEVVLGFMEEDPGNPVILGSLYSKPLPPKHPPNDANDCKWIVTRSDIQMMFDDKEKIFEIATPGGRKVRLDDKDEKVTIVDPFGNTITMEKAKVEILSTGALNLQSTKEMTIQAGTNLSVTAKNNYDLSAVKITEAAKGALAVSGSASAEFKSSGILTVQGSLVKIN